MPADCASRSRPQAQCSARGGRLAEREVATRQKKLLLRLHGRFAVVEEYVAAQPLV